MPTRPGGDDRDAVGTVFLLTDIEGSTRLWDQAPAEMQRALARHDELVATVVARNAGALIKSRGEGDSTFSVFADPVAGARSALELQLALTAEEWSDRARIRIRIAVHAGTAEERDGDFFGEAVNRCARLRGAAHGGQVVLSEVVARAVSSCLPDGAVLTDLGSHRLRDLSKLERVFQLDHPGLPSVFPPLATADLRRHNIPAPTTSFIGRDEEARRVKGLLEASRMVTLTGPGGSGKTRLALRVARDVVGHFPDGVWVVELATTSNPASVPTALAAALNIQEESGRSLLSSVRDHLRDKDALIVLDNCEHLVSACAEVSADLLAAAPGLRVIATSREVLGVPGEALVAVAPLQLPAADASVVEIGQSESVRLFLERAHAVTPDLPLDDQTVEAVGVICRRLDGIPLAIEIAAAKTRMHTILALRDRLVDRFGVLTGGSRVALPRHRTLRATIDWSFDLLSAPERYLLARLSVFVGGWTLDAAERVCAGPELDDPGVAETLASLADKSMVSVPDASGRYRMLETIREYAGERLTDWGELPYLRVAHLRWAFDVAISSRARFGTGDETDVLARLADEHPNLRAALEWAEGTGEVTTALEMAVALARFWELRGHWSEGAAVLARLLEITAERDALWCEGCICLCRLYQDIADGPGATRFARSALEVARALDDRRLEASALYENGTLALGSGTTEAETLMREALEIRRELGDTQAIAESLTNLSYVCKDAGDLDGAAEVLAEALVLFRASDNKQGISWALTSLADIDQRRGDLVPCRAHNEEALALRRELGDRTGIGDSLTNLGVMWMFAGEPRRAVECLEEAAESYHTVGQRLGGLKRDLALARFLADDLEGAKQLCLEFLRALDPPRHALGASPLAALGCIVAREGRTGLGVRCIAAADRIASAPLRNKGAGGGLYSGVIQQELRATVDSLKAQLGAGFDEAWRAGATQEMSSLLGEVSL